jgi:pimeloyl-ACP methyl ester carboxylesterase
MKISSALLIVIAACSFHTVSDADEIALGHTAQVESRGVSVPIFEVWKDNAVATLVLYSGGAGGYGKIGADGWPGSRNFLIRSAKLFAAHPFNVILVGRAPDVPTLDGLTRIGDDHDLDNQAIFRSIKARSSAPMWLVGTSMGTISVTAAAIRDAGSSIAGIVLSSSVTAYRVTGAVTTQDLAKINIPALVLHHENDACKVCPPEGAKSIFGSLKNSPIKRLVFVSGGEGASGDPCEALHHHGYIGIEKEVVDVIAAWVTHPSM